MYRTILALIFTVVGNQAFAGVFSSSPTCDDEEVVSTAFNQWACKMLSCSAQGKNLEEIMALSNEELSESLWNMQLTELAKSFDTTPDKAVAAGGQSMGVSQNTYYKWAKYINQLMTSAFDNVRDSSLRYSNGYAKNYNSDIQRYDCVLEITFDADKFQRGMAQAAATAAITLNQQMAFMMIASMERMEEEEFKSNAAGVLAAAEAEAVAKQNLRAISSPRPLKYSVQPTRDGFIVTDVVFGP